MNTDGYEITIRISKGGYANERILKLRLDGAKDSIMGGYMVGKVIEDMIHEHANKEQQ